MSSWNLNLRTLFGSRREQSRTRRSQTTVRPKVEVLEDRSLPSTTSANPLAIVTVASPPAVPSVTAITSYVESTMGQWMQLLATVQQDFGNAFNALGQEIAQKVSAVQQQWDHVLGSNPNLTNPSLNSAVTQPSRDSGSGRGNASGSGRGGSATTTSHNASNHTLNNSTQNIGSGSGRGSSTTTTRARFANNALAPVRHLYSGTGSGPATVDGNVWLDSDYDGNPDNGELGYYGATVNLDVVDPSTGSIEGGFGTQTNSSGSYSFTITEDPIGHYYEIQVVFPWSFFATKPGYSQINAQGYTATFHMAAGDVVQKNAGIASMNVDTTQDDANNQKIQNKVTLRDAIQTGNNGPPQPAVTFYSAPNTALNGTITLGAQQLDPIKKSYNIDGPGAGILAVNGNNNASTIFTVNAGVTSTISGLTIEGGSGASGGGILNNGDLSLSGDNIQNNNTTGAGGGVCNSGAGAILQLKTVTISDNSATNGGGGLANIGGKVSISGGVVITNNTSNNSGGGILNDDGGNVTATGNTQINLNLDSRTRGGGVENDGGKFQMYGGSISNNEESQFGGGVGIIAGTMTLTGVAIQGNNPNGGTRGGGIYVDGGTLTLINVTIGGEGNAGKNVATRGGGMFVMDGTVKMSRGEITNNTATTTGARVGGGQGGGGLFVNGGSVTLTKVSVSGNGSRFNGGGVYVNGGALKLNGDSIVNNGTRLNKGGNGGGIFINAGNVTVNGGSISANSAPFGAGSGGGIFNNTGTLTLNASLTFGTPVNIINNSAETGGGGMFLANASTTNINDVTVSGNHAPTGPGVFEQKNAIVNIAENGLVDNDDPGGKPYNSGIA